MIPVYKLFKNLLILFINLLFIIQIILIILIFLTAAYWFFDLIGSSLFSFAEPIADYIIDFMRLFYNRDINVGGVYVDGSLLLFDIIAIIVIFIFTKSKYYIYKAQNFCDEQIIKCKKSIEAGFNVQLKKEAEEMIKKYTGAAIIITFTANDLKVDRFWGGDSTDEIKKTEKYLADAYYSEFSKVSYVSLKKGGNKVIVSIKDFNKIDNILNMTNSFIKKNRAEMRKNKWTMDYYCAVVAYSDGASIELDVMPKLESLLRIKQKNEIICFGDFNLRYTLKEKPLFYGLKLKGSYAIDGGSDVYCLVKKD